MNELIRTSQLVKSILEQEERARNSDSFLYFRVLGVLGLHVGVDVLNMPVSDFLLNMAGRTFPGFETVRRTRQTVQRNHPELAANRTARDWRNNREKEYRAFARRVRR